MSTVHTSDLDHGLASALHDTHSTFIEINRVEGEPSRYVVTFTHRYSVAATSPVEALAAATESLRAAMGTREVEQQRQRAEKAEARASEMNDNLVRFAIRAGGLAVERDELQGRLAEVSNIANIELQRAEQAVADRDRWIARTVKAEDQLDGAAWDELTYERDRLRGEAGALAELVQQLARRAEKAETALAALSGAEVSDA